jgi:long-chain fatty acid transport protein
MTKNIYFSGSVRAISVGLGLGAVLLLQAGEAYAVDGTGLSGIGVKSAGMGGASIALPQDSAAAANNPAGMALIGTRTDLGVQLLSPIINYQYGSASNEMDSDKLSPVPEGGINWQVNDRVTAGVSIFGNGIATDYGRPALPLPGASTAKSSLLMMIAVPTVTYRVTEHQYIGVSASLAYQRFSASGVNTPDAQGNLQPLASHGTASAFGYGGRIGYIWQPTPTLNIGASYASRIRMGKLSGYDSDLLAPSDGRIDLPSQYGLGIAYSPIPSLTFAADWLHISWSDTILGSSQAFDWQDQNVFRLGASYDINSIWTVRAGITRARQSYDSNAVAANFLSALPNARAISTGLTYRINATNEVSGVFEYGFPVTISGSGQSTGFQSVSRTLVFGLSFGHKF